ncbi:MAG: hypothetical protein GY739_17010 [Mesoflavibacter sp.]|nr:hypothetical protein [Mesoflavibacter sp.]
MGDIDFANDIAGAGGTLADVKSRMNNSMKTMLRFFKFNAVWSWNMFPKYSCGLQLQTYVS